MTETKQTTCADVVEDRCKCRLNDLRCLMLDYDEGHNMESLDEYGLCFDRVYPETFDDQPEGYWRYQISYGGPAEEIRFYFDHSTPSDESGGASRCYRIEFWHLDWGDGANVDITDDETARRLWDWMNPVH